jgi:hypothetical protein
VGESLPDEKKVAEEVSEIPDLEREKLIVY